MVGSITILVVCDLTSATFQVGPSVVVLMV